MPSFELGLDVPDVVSREMALNSFFWPLKGSGSFRTPLDPYLATLGPVRPANVDLVRIAASVYGADRSVKRAVGKVNWTSRELGLVVPVHDPEAWGGVRADLQELLGFLSGDRWELSFRGDDGSASDVVANPYPGAKRVVLLSGGADSAVGAFLARSQPEEHVLVSHVGASSVAHIQSDVAQQIRNLAPTGSGQHHRQLYFTRTLRQPGGLKLPGELSTRTRSLLFLALGLALASMNGVPLWIPENGFASLNPPMGADQLGSLSTRTTHPWFLAELSRLATAAGAQAEIENPFAAQTKGEMFRFVADDLSDDNAASDFLSSTNSCAYTNKRFDGMSPRTHCGVCFGCLMRRASFAAAGLEDKSLYVVDAPPSADVAARLEKASILPSIEGFLTRGLGVGDIAAMRLPSGYLPSAARVLCRRGMSELEALL